MLWKHILRSLLVKRLSRLFDDRAANHPYELLQTVKKSSKIPPLYRWRWLIRSDNDIKENFLSGKFILETRFEMSLHAFKRHILMKRKSKLIFASPPAYTVTDPIHSHTFLIKSYEKYAASNFVLVTFKTVGDILSEHDTSRCWVRELLVITIGIALAPMIFWKGSWWNFRERSLYLVTCLSPIYIIYYNW